MPAMYDREVAPRISKLFECLNNTWTVTTTVDMPMRTGRVSQDPASPWRAIEN